MVYPNRLFSDKKKWPVKPKEDTLAIYYWKKPVSEGYILYDSVWNSEKGKIMEV